jgi:flavin reductase (DIM6/NTAB) family NADH-FMN oxidoreductase RutF
MAPYHHSVASGDELRTLMRRVPAGIAVVGVDADGTRLAVTVGSFVSLSLDPPLVGVAVGRNLALHELLREAGGFSVSVLRGEQESLAQHFARGVPPIALWSGIALREREGAPQLADALGWLDCRVWAQYPAGDHTLFVGEVVDIELGEPGTALVYVESAYRPM